MIEGSKEVHFQGFPRDRRYFAESVVEGPSNRHWQGGLSPGFTPLPNSLVKRKRLTQFWPFALVLTIDIRMGNGLTTLFNTIHDLRFSYFE